ncbi:N-acetyl sugar amidotransferase [Chryseobacterium sp. MP_3.2]|uniref:N-acetyl sugar amidotransferase n=1 Tax=Chryseobacterium sp. MP_3.2 TaxID=3071712 RepID=UPI002E03E6D9|nr:N-acetyl sugar amidotransferase [Chryseobacterium sp. MP_3.2]
MKQDQICTKTVMDTTDPTIIFNERGESDHYTNFQQNILPDWNFGEGKLDELMKVAGKIKKHRKGKDFDCIIGISGGLDSSYALYVAKEIMGLRPLAFHVDAGWNTDHAVKNIESIVKNLNVDLYTEVINWEEMKDLQVSFLRSQIPDQDLPQDIAFFSSLYAFAKKHKIEYVITGGNYSTECCREPEDWGAYPGIDKKLILDIHKKFGKIKLKTFPIIDIVKYKIYYKYVFGLNVFKPLNYIVYEKESAEKLLSEKLDWKPFKHKHHESRFTRFFEDFWLPKKFGFDRRKAHFSSLIMTNQMTRENALKKIAETELSADFHDKEFGYIADKLDLNREELQLIFDGENRTFRDYRNKKWFIDLGSKILSRIGVEKRLFR